MKKRWLIKVLFVVFCFILLSACDMHDSAVSAEKTTLEEIEFEETPVILTDAPETVPTDVSVSAEVQKEPIVEKVYKEKKTDKAIIDYTNAADGFVQTKYTSITEKSLKARVQGPTTTYTYCMTAGKWEVFPLSDGNGKYQVSIYENATANKYALVASAAFDVALKNEFVPFLSSNQYVDYKSAPETIAKAKELTAGTTDPLKKVGIVYDYVVKNTTYDKQKAATMKAGYLPVLDQVLAEKKGICFDYASLMTGMLRSQEIPCKLVVGYAGTAYHAWINVWTKETGWIDGMIYFDGNSWHRMDPTFASSGKQSEAIMKYIGDGSNYTVKYIY